MKKIPEFRAKVPMYLTKKDKRYKHYAKQLKKTGFCDTELWSLDYTIASFILPRLIRFKKIKHGFPIFNECYDKGDVNLSDKQSSTKNEELWNSCLDKMIFAFTEISTDKSDFDRDDKLIQEGLDLFAKHFRGLWD